MIDRIMLNKMNESGQQLETAIPLGKMLEKLKNASPEEKKITAEIAKKIGEFSRAKDLPGLQKYLAHVRTKL